MGYYKMCKKLVLQAVDPFLNFVRNVYDEHQLTPDWINKCDEQEFHDKVKNNN